MDGGIGQRDEHELRRDHTGTTKGPIPSFTANHQLSHNLSSLKRALSVILSGIIIGVIKRDTGSLDSPVLEGFGQG